MLRYLNTLVVSSVLCVFGARCSTRRHSARRERGGRRVTGDCDSHFDSARGEPWVVEPGMERIGEMSYRLRWALYD